MTIHTLFITGNPSWGIAWYINGTLIPELHLMRGTTYTFRVAGGDDIQNGAQYHPLYLTSSPDGGFSATQVSSGNKRKNFTAFFIKMQP